MSKPKNRKVIIPPIEDEDRNKMPDVFPERMSLDELRKIWNDKKVQYSDDELYRIREWLYTIANVVVHVVKENDDDTLQTIRNSKRRKVKKGCIVFGTQNVNAA